MTLTDSSPEEIAALRQILQPSADKFEVVCDERSIALRPLQLRRWLAYDVWCLKPELLTRQCLALVGELLPTLTEKTTACLALFLIAGNVGGFGWMTWEVLS